jgi:hypothetical protein
MLPQLRSRLLGAGEQRAGLVGPYGGKPILACSVTLGRKGGVGLTISAARDVTRQISNQPLLFTCDSAVVFHDGFVQSDEGLRDRRAPLHRQHAVRHEPQRLEEELSEVSHLLGMVGCKRRDEGQNKSPV